MSSGQVRVPDDRLMWHYDARAKIKQNGWGWAAWEWWGHMRVSYSTSIHMWGSGMPANKSIHTRPPTLVGPQTVPCRSGLDMDGGIDLQADAQFGMAGALFNWTARPRPW